MAMITHAAPTARAARLHASHLSHVAAYAVFAAAGGFMLAVVFGLLP
jgi:hypothetical protein